MLGTLTMRQHPLAAGEERRPNAFRAQVVDDCALITGYLVRLLTKIECQGYELEARWQVDSANCRRLDGSIACPCIGVRFGADLNAARMSGWMR